MASFKQNYWVLIWMTLVLLLLLVLSKEYNYQLKEFTLMPDGKEQRPVTMPISEQPELKNGIYEVRGHLSIGRLTTKTFIFIPDDQLIELRVNDITIDLSQYPSAALRDYVRGVSIDLKDYLNVGDNKIFARYQDSGGRMGLKIVANPINIFFITLSLAWTMFVLLVAYFVIRAGGVGRLFTGLLVIALLIRIMHFIVEDYNVRGHDTYEHLDYINHFVENKSLPPVEMSARRVFFHPPLYYATTAIFSSAFEFITGQSRLVNRAIQALSLAYSMLFLIFAVKTILLLFAQVGTRSSSERELANSSFSDCLQYSPARYAWMSCLLLVMWPSTILHSVRIGNDSLLYALSAAALYYLVKFYFYPRAKYAIFFAVSVSLGIITKVSAAIFLPVALLVLLKMLLNGQVSVRHDLLRLISVPTVLFLASLAFALYPGVALKLQGEKENFYIEDINNLHSGLRVPNDPRSYFWFDIKTFMTEAYTSPWEDDKGRVFFWNYLAKTSLFGEWQFPDVTSTIFASVISLCFLAILFYTIVAALNMRWPDFHLLFPFIFFSVGMYAAVTYMRITFPVNIDFRYIVPTLICSAIFFNYCLYRLQIAGHHRLSFLGVVTQYVFIISSIFFVASIFIHGVLSVK